MNFAYSDDRPSASELAEDAHTTRIESLWGCNALLFTRWEAACKIIAAATRSGVSLTNVEAYPWPDVKYPVSAIVIHSDEADRVADELGLSERAGGGILYGWTGRVDGHGALVQAARPYPRPAAAAPARLFPEDTIAWGERQ